MSDKTTTRVGEGDRSPEDEESLRQRVEESLAGLVPEVVKRALDAGLETIGRAETRRILGRVNELKLPRDLARYFLAQVDETKNALLSVFAREVREFLEHTDLAQELRRALTSVTLEVKTQVRFIPNEANEPAEGDDGGASPDAEGSHEDG